VDAFAAQIDAALDLRALARRGPEEANLLPRRLVELGLDPDEIARLEPALFRELHWHCTMCDSTGECSVDLAGIVGAYRRVARLLSQCRLAVPCLMPDLPGKNCRHVVASGLQWLRSATMQKGQAGKPPFLACCRIRITAH